MTEQLHHYGASGIEVKRNAIMAKTRPYYPI